MFCMKCKKVGILRVHIRCVVLSSLLIFCVQCSLLADTKSTATNDRKEKLFVNKRKIGNASTERQLESNIICFDQCSSFIDAPEGDRGVRFEKFVHNNEIKHENRGPTQIFWQPHKIICPKPQNSKDPQIFNYSLHCLIGSWIMESIG